MHLYHGIIREEFFKKFLEKGDSALSCSIMMLKGSLVLSVRNAMGRVKKKIRPAPLDSAIGQKPSKGKSPIKISKPAAAKSRPNGDSPDKAALQAALASEEINTKAVEEAKKALAAGELDNPEAIRRAAEQILDSGL